MVLSCKFCALLRKDASVANRQPTFPEFRVRITATDFDGAVEFLREKALKGWLKGAFVKALKGGVIVPCAERGPCSSLVIFRESYRSFDWGFRHISGKMYALIARPSSGRPLTVEDTYQIERILSARMWQPNTIIFPHTEDPLLYSAFMNAQRQGHWIAALD